MPPKSKGDRDAMMTRPPRAVGNIIRERASTAGVPYGDYISAILCQHVGMGYLMPIPEPMEPLDNGLMPTPETPDFFDRLRETNVRIEGSNLPRTA
jgi:hypothetical protein